MDNIQKLCILSFDEIKVKKTYWYDKPSDSTLGPVSYVQVAMLRGLMSRWKQPIFYDFDCKMTTNILEEILRETKRCGYIVVGMVSDLGCTNRSLYAELKINEDKPSFIFEEREVFVFADVPHLIKLLRNHFIDRGFLLNGKEVKKDIILELPSCTSADLSITHKISGNCLCVTGAQRQIVKMATKLFSHTVAQAIMRAASLGYLDGKNWEECHKLFKPVNDWFDVMNVRVPHSDSRERCHAYGLAIDIQSSILDKMTEMIINLRVIGKNSLLPFQRGIIQTNNALKGLFEHVQKHYNINYILTYRLNQDVLENFFGVIRAKGGLHDHPDQQEFKYRLRSYILGKNEGVISDAANVKVDDTPDLEISQPPFTGIIFKAVTFDSEGEEIPDEMAELEGVEYDGLENLTGYICHKLRDQVDDISVDRDADASYTWVSHLSEGGLTKPSEELMGKMASLQHIFQNINGDGLFISKKYLQTHMEESSEIDCSNRIKKLFFRARMFFKIRQLNKELEESIHKKKRKLNKIIK